MKRLFPLFLALSLSSMVSGQGLPPVPADDVNLRLEMAGAQMRKAGISRNTSIGIAIAGGIFTALASDRSAKVYDQRGAFVIAVATGVGFAAFQYKGSRHDRKAGAILSGHR